MTKSADLSLDPDRNENLTWQEAERRYPGCSAAWDLYLIDNTAEEFELVDMLYSDIKYRVIIAKMGGCQGKYAKCMCAKYDWTTERWIKIMQYG